MVDNWAIAVVEHVWSIHMNKKKRFWIRIYVEISIFHRSHRYIIETHTSMLTEFSPRNFLQNYMEYVMNESRIKEKISTLQILKTCSKIRCLFSLFSPFSSSLWCLISCRFFYIFRLQMVSLFPLGISSEGEMLPFIIITRGPWATSLTWETVPNQ